MSSSLTKGFNGTASITGQVLTILDGYTIQPLPIIHNGPLSVTLDGYTIQPLPIVNQGADSFPILDGYATILSVSSVITISDSLPAGNYLLISTTDIWFNPGSSPIAIWQANGKCLPAGFIFPIKITSINSKIAAITGGATGKLNIIPVT